MILDRKQAPHNSINFSFPEIKPQKYVLPNGIPLYVFDTGSQELCKIELVFTAGNYYESNPLIAYATNALMREGTISKTASEIAEQLDFHGAFLELSIYTDKSSVVLYSLNKHLNKTLPVLIDIIQHANYPEKEVILFKTNQKQKFLVNQQKVDFVARNYFNKLLFNQSPYNQFIVESDYDKITPEQLQKFYYQQYQNNNWYIVMAGKIHQEQILELTQTLGQLHLHGEKTDVAYQNNIGAGQKQYIEKADALQSAIRIGRRLFNKKHEDYYGMLVLNTILGGYFGSRLMANIREDKGYTYGIGSGIVSLQHDGFFCISTEVGTEVTQDALNEIYKEIEQLQQEPVSNDELNLVKNYMQGTFLRSVDGPFALSDKFTAINDYGLTNNYYINYVEYIKQAKAEDIMRLAQKYLNKSDLSQLVVGKL